MEAGCYAKLMLTLLAVICFTRHCRPYLRIFGWPFTVTTDHSSLAWLYSFKEPESKLVQWLEHIQEYGFEVFHCNGRNRNNADALSRLLVSGEEEQKTASILANVYVAEQGIQQCKTSSITIVQSDRSVLHV